MDINKREQNEFNMAVSYLGRLNNLLYLCDSASMERNADGWFHSLLALSRELSTEMKDDEIEEISKKRTIINNLLHNQNIQYMRTQRMEISNELYNNLNELELFLRNVLKESGLQSKMKDDPINAFGN